MHGAKMQEHPLRRHLAEELQARPYGLLQAPTRISHIAMLSDEHSAEADHAHLSALCKTFCHAPPPKGASHYVADLGPFQVTWERHTEFATYTFTIEGDFDAPFKDPAISKVPVDWLDAMPGEMLSATHLEMSNHLDHFKVDRLIGYFDNNPIAGARLVEGKGGFWSDFHIHADGFARVLVRGDKISARQGGRVVQRILDVMTYRMMAMLAFPVAKEIRPKIANGELTLSNIMTELADENIDHSDQELLKRLSGLAADVEDLITDHTYRFNASEAYYRLVQRRMEELRQGRISGIPTPQGFVMKRLMPAMETCRAMSTRLEALSNRINHATGLLRTRVDVDLQEQNASLLQSMDRRARVQLRLQETVEGLSVVAISYYMVGLVQYLAKGAKVAGVRIDPDIAAGVSIPIIVGAVWIGVKRLRKALTKDEEA